LGDKADEPAVGAIGAEGPDERQAREAVARWRNGEQTVQFLINRGRLESFEAADLTTSAEALIARARLRVEATAKAALKMVTSMAPTLLPTMPTGWPLSRS
jgi:hypothetical protein